MKKIIYLLLVLPLLALFTGCSDKEDIIFDHERPQFQIKENAILLEVIMPQGSTPDDDYYITGPFNGDSEAIGNLTWKLEKAPESNFKWGIYLIPSTFIDGKTLADGFTFHAAKQGAERSVFNEPVTHTLNVGVGTRTNVWVDRWESYFGTDRDYYRIYVDDQSGWDELALHYWGAEEGSDVVGTEWPGLQVAGTEEISGVTYKYFNLPPELNGKRINTIFNNNGKGAQFNAMMNYEVAGDYYVRITDNSYEPIDPNDLYNGYTIYVQNDSDWEWQNISIYGWYGEGDVTPPWPGLKPLGLTTINGIEFIYYHWGEELNGRMVNMIFSNNGSNEFNSLQGFEITRDVYLRITNNSSVEIDPNGETGGDVRTIYLDNQAGWPQQALYYYDAGNAEWPGMQPTGTKEINGITYIYFELPETLEGETVNIIFNNNGNGTQIDVEEPIIINRDYYYRIYEDNTYKEIGYRIYVNNQSGWSALHLYYWGAQPEIAWPGMEPSGTVTLNNVEYTYFELPAAITGQTINTIFNNGEGGEGNQFDAMGDYVVNKDIYINITNNSYEEVDI